MGDFRVIPILSIDNSKLVKTVKFKKPRYIGDPINAIRVFNDKQVDELAIVDIKASVQSKEPDYRLLGDMASECFMPISYGGGISKVSQAERIFGLGIEKIIINSSLFLNSKLISDLVSSFGSQSVVVSIDYKKNWMRRIVVTGYSGTKTFNISPLEYARKVESLGCGEIILTSVDKDGGFSGLDLTFCSEIIESVGIPVICNGGLNSLKNIEDAEKIGLSGVAGGSFFVYKNNNPDSILINYPSLNKNGAFYE